MTVTASAATMVASCKLCILAVDIYECWRVFPLNAHAVHLFYIFFLFFFSSSRILGATHTSWSRTALLLFRQSHNYYYFCRKSTHRPIDGDSHNDNDDYESERVLLLLFKESAVLCRRSHTHTQSSKWATTKKFRSVCVCFLFFHFYNCFY